MESKDRSNTIRPTKDTQINIDEGLDVSNELTRRDSFRLLLDEAEAVHIANSTGRAVGHVVRPVTMHQPPERSKPNGIPESDLGAIKSSGRTAVMRLHAQTATNF